MALPRVVIVDSSPEHWSAGYSEPYEQALRAAGVEPVMVSPANGPSNPLDGADGLLLMGGDDVDPARYGESRQAETEAPDVLRDEMELKLIEECLDRDLPLLGICRGLQVLNVQHGGSLVQHLPTAAHHRRRTGDKSMPVHQVRIVPGTLLAAVAGEASTLDVNSRHHQAIDRLGAGLHVSARDPEDAIIEAVERADKRFCLAVQWHPENQSPVDPRQAKLFEAFAAALRSQT